jgi:hypothetical protein
MKTKTAKFVEDMVRSHIRDAVDDPIGFFNTGELGGLEVYAGDFEREMQPICLELGLPEFWVLVREESTSHEFERFQKLFPI